ncbi:MAG: RNA-binding S4 domain-containing protein [Peptostreptococcaceae bacterium]|nr:RNA-binding S4 domain-containing protein [Peptostreptococcaceae bacterium]
MKEVKISGEYIKLDQFLKLADEAGSGGEAKILILSGEASVNGERESRRGRKLRPGDEVSVGDRAYRVV